MANIKIGWEASGGKRSDIQLSRNVRELDDKLRRVITGEFIYHSAKAVEYAKLNAPWTDRTGNARSGLHANVNVSGANKNHWELIVSHSMYYGIYLEVCNSGKYAIIMPTVKYIGPLLLKRMERAIERIGGSAR